MGVRVRLSRNSTAYFPFWLAIPALMIYGVVYVAIAIVAGICIAVLWLVGVVIGLGKIIM